MNNNYHEMQGRRNSQADMDLFQSPLSNNASSFYRPVSSDSSMSVFSDLGSGSTTMSPFNHSFPGATRMSPLHNGLGSGNSRMNSFHGPVSGSASMGLLSDPVSGAASPNSYPRSIIGHPLQGPGMVYNQGPGLGQQERLFGLRHPYNFHEYNYTINSGPPQKLFKEDNDQFEQQFDLPEDQLAQQDGQSDQQDDQSDEGSEHDDTFKPEQQSDDGESDLDFQTPPSIKAPRSRPNVAGPASAEKARKEASLPYQALIRNQAHYQELKNRPIGEEMSETLMSGGEYDFPVSEEEQQKLVRELFESIKYTENVLDKPGKDGRPAQAVRRIRDGFYPNELIEMKCWELLLGCRDAAMGVRLVDKTYKQRREEHENFFERFQKIIEGCKISKALCKQIMDPPYIHRLIDAPAAETQMKHNNKKINAERDIQNEIGRNAVKRGIKLDDLDLIAKPESKDVDFESALETNQPAEFTTPKRRTHRSSTTVPSTNKRKSRSTARRVKVEPDEVDDDDDSDGNYGSPSPAKRTRSSAKVNGPVTRRKSARRPRSASSTQATVVSTGSPIARTPCAKRQASTGASKRRPTISSGLANMKLPSETTIQDGAESATSDAAHQADDSMSLIEKYTMNGNISQDSDYDRELLERLEVSFKLCICHLLHVDESWAHSEFYTLDHFRTYARAYNQEFADDDWYYHNAVGRGFTLTVDGRKYEHFANYLVAFQGLAAARGDILGGTQHFTVNPEAPYKDGFGRKEDTFIRAALGIVPNPLGLHPNLHNM